MPRRYAILEEDPDKWAVYDVFTGQAVRLKGKRVDELDIEDARVVAGVLNVQDLTRRVKPGTSGTGSEGSPPLQPPDAAT